MRMVKSLLLAILQLSILVNYRVMADGESICLKQYEKLVKKSAKDIPETKKAALYIDLGFNENEKFSRAIGSNLLFSYRDNFPQQGTIYIRVYSEEGLRHEVERLSKSNTMFSRIWISSHGNRGEVFVLDQKGIARSLSMNSMALILKSLPLAPDASVHFDGCKVLEGKSPGYLSEFADAMGLKSGRLYANRTGGTQSLKDLARTSIFETMDPVHCMTQVLAPLFYPIEAIVENLFFNKGTQLVRTPKGNDCLEQVNGIDISDAMENGD